LGKLNKGTTKTHLVPSPLFPIYNNPPSYSSKIYKIHRRLPTGSRNHKRRITKANNKKLFQLKNNTVTNLSSYKLSLTELSLLNKGLTFVPHSDRINYNELHSDLLRFERKLQLHLFFHNENSDNEEDNDYEENKHKFESNSKWWPKKLHPELTEFCRNLENVLYRIIKRNKGKSNLSRYEYAALNKLKRNKNIIIKKADKNSGIVVMNTKDYEIKVNSMLADANVYTLVEDYDKHEVKLKSDILLRKIHDFNYITDKQYKHLTCYPVKIPIFYGIPKIHKKDNPLRPIVSQINSPTYKINQYIHELLLVGESEIPHLFKDTTAFLNYIEKNKEVDENTFLVTMDVVSLYTNIPHTEAIDYICEHYNNTLNKWHNYSVGVLPVELNILKELLEVMLSNCTFEFNDNLYKQNYGTPMGAPASVRIANIYMFKFLENFLNTYNDDKPHNIGRLIDDIFFIWKFPEDKLLKLYNSLNNYHSTIKFEIHYSRTEVTFLDTVTYIEDNSIHTKLYIKPTDKKQYLHYSSCHPKHIKKAIPYSQALRYRRIIDNDHILVNELEKLKDKFLLRGYPNTEIETQLSRVHNLNRTDTLIYKTAAEKRLEFLKFTRNGPFLPLIITYKNEYINDNENLYKIFTTLWKTFIENNADLQQTFNNVTPQIVFKRDNTLANILIRAKFYSNSTNISTTTLDNTVRILAELNAESNNQFTVRPCQNATCKLCFNIKETDHFVSTVTNIQYEIINVMDCNTTNVIYLITCTKCRKQYIGETKRKLKDRFHNHRSDIKLKKHTAIAIHFNNILHSYSNITVTPIEIEIDPVVRKIRENYWIKEIQTRYPLGLNHYPL